MATFIAVGFDKRLKLAMANAGLSAGQLAVRLETSTRAVQDWLCGIDSPGCQRLPELVELLGINWSWLLTGQSSAAALQTIDDYDQEGRFDDLPAADREKIVSLMGSL